MTELPLPEFHPIVSKVWQTDVKGDPMYKVFAKLRLVKKDLSDLNRKSGANCSEKVQMARAALQSVQSLLQLNETDSQLKRQEKSTVLKNFGGKGIFLHNSERDC